MEQLVFRPPVCSVLVVLLAPSSLVSPLLTGVKLFVLLLAVE